MSDSIGKIHLDLGVNEAGFQNELNGIAKKANKMSVGAFATLGKSIAMAFSVAALVGFGRAALTLASDLEEVQNVVDTVFGQSSEDINNFAKGALKNFGLSELAAKQFSSTMGAMLKSSGLSTDHMITMSKAMTALSGDIASFNNLKPEEAFQKIRSGIAGETEGLKALGINMSVANLETFALTQGIKKQYNAMSQQEQMILRYNYLMKTTSYMQGDFAKTSGSWANQTRILTEQFKTFLSLMGSGFMTILTPVIRLLNLLVSKLIIAAQYFKAFVNMIFGKKEKSEAVTVANEEVSDSLGGIGSAAKGAAKKVKGSLAAFDQLNTINLGLADSASGAADGIGGGGASFAPVDFNGPDTDGPIAGLEELDKKMEVLKGKFLTFTEPLRAAFRTVYDTAIKPFIKLFTKAIKDTLDIAKGLWDKHGLDIVKSLQIAWKSIQGVFQSLWTVIIKPILENTLRLWRNLWESHLKGLVEQLGTTWLKLYELFQTLIGVVIMPLIKFLIDTFGPTFVRVFKSVQEKAFGMSAFVIDAITGILKILGGLAEFATGALTGDWGKAMNGLKTVAETIMAGITKLFGNSINSIISMVNSLIRSLNKLKVKVPDWVPGIGGKEFGFNLTQLGYLNTSGYSTSAEAGANSSTKNNKLATMMATGGVTKQPTLAMIGEGRYKEAVIPLENSPQMQDLINKVAAAAQGSSGGYNGPEEVVVKIGETEFARIAIRALNNYARQTGSSMITV